MPTVAIDLDGTLAKPYEKFDPKKIEDPRPGAKKALEEFQRRGFRIIVFTVRGDKQLVKDWLHAHDMPYDYVNENPDQPPDTSGKVIADVYIDDRAIDGSVAWASIAEKALHEFEKEAAEIVEPDEPDEPGKKPRRSNAMMRAIHRYSPVSPVATLTSGGGPGVGVRIRGTPLITDIDPTGPGAGVGVSPKALASVLRRFPGPRMQLIARRVEQLPGKIYLGVELIGALPSPFVGASADLADAELVMQQWVKLRAELKEQQRKKNAKGSRGSQGK